MFNFYLCVILDNVTFLIWRLFLKKRFRIGINRVMNTGAYGCIRMLMGVICLSITGATLFWLFVPMLATVVLTIGSYFKEGRE